MSERSQQRCNLKGGGYISRPLLYAMLISTLVHLAVNVCFIPLNSLTMIVNTAPIEAPLSLTLFIGSEHARPLQQQVTSEPLPSLITKASTEPLQLIAPSTNSSFLKQQKQNDTKRQARITEQTAKRTSTVPACASKTMMKRKAVTSSRQISDNTLQKINIRNSGDSPVQVTPPSILHQVKPLYPSHYSRNNIEGSVTLTVNIDEAGKVSNVSVLKSSGYEALDISAMTAVRHWTFKPEQHNGKCVKTKLLLPVSFQIALRSRGQLES